MYKGYTYNQILKAKKFIGLGAVKRVSKGIYQVKSSFWTYEVIRDTYGKWYCPCQGYQTKEKQGYKQPICSHILAAQMYEKINGGKV